MADIVFFDKLQYVIVMDFLYHPIHKLSKFSHLSYSNISVNKDTSDMSEVGDMPIPILSNDRVWEYIHASKTFVNANNLIHVTYKSTHYELRAEKCLMPFVLDLKRSSISLKYTFQTRVYATVCLIRFDYGGTHTNPKQKCEIDENDPFYQIHYQCVGKKYKNEPHIHIYREGFDDRWAYPVEGVIDTPGDISKSLIEFLRYCGVSKVPHIQEDLYDQCSKRDQRNA